MKNGIPVPIFLASNNNYAPFVSTTIISIVKNTTAFINFYILDGGINNKNKEKIKKIKNQFKNFSIEFIDMKNFELERFPNIAHYSTSAFSRYFIPEIKPHLKKILYLDVDIIVKGDIYELFNQNLENYPLGAILEDFYPQNSIYLKKIYPKYNGGTNYFNSGVLVVELDYFKKNNITNILVNKTNELKDVLNCPDQDVLNIIFENNFKILDYKFNFMPFHQKHFMKNEKVENPIIIHYTAEKPWKNSETEGGDDFWEIAKLSPFYAELEKNIKLPKLLKNIPSKEKIKHIKYLLKTSHGIKKCFYSLKLFILNFIIQIKTKNSKFL